MSVTPEGENYSVVTRSSIQPTDKQENLSVWRKFLDAMRQVVGRKPLYQAVRLGEAHVRKHEVEPDIAVLKALGDFELAKARADAMRSEAKGKLLKDTAEANLKDAHAGAISHSVEQLAQMIIDSEQMSVEDASDWVASVMSEISISGGSVEFEQPDLPKIDSESLDHDDG